MTSTSAHKISLRRENLNTLYKWIDKHFHEQIKSVKQALYHGIRNEALSIRKHQFILNYKLNRPIKIRETGIIIEIQVFCFGASPDGVIFGKKIHEIGILQVKCLDNRRNLSIDSIITDKIFYIALNKEDDHTRRPYLKKELHFGFYTQNEVAVGLAGLKWCHCVVYIYSRMIILRVDFDRDCFKCVIDYNINALLSRQ